MRRHLVIAILAAVATSAYAGEKAGGQFDYRTQVGVAEVNAEGEGCLTVKSAALRENETIDLITLHVPQAIIEARTIKKLSRSCSRNPAVPPDASFYSFQAGKAYLEPSIAVAGFKGGFEVVNGKVHADLNGDGSLESFRSCTGREGLHLTVWAGEPLKTRRLWHEYYYLGYDIEPSCTKKDYEP